MTAKEAAVRMGHSKPKPVFWRSKFCKGEKDCSDKRVTAFKHGVKGIRYQVCGSSEACSLKSDFPVRAKPKEAAC